MNFEDAITAHIKWKVRLAMFVDGTGNEELRSAAVCKDNQCVLGQWIHGHGVEYSPFTHYHELVRKHAKFHVCAAEIVRKVENADQAGARSVLGSAFAAASKETITTILHLWREARRRDRSADWPGARCEAQSSSPTPSRRGTVCGSQVISR